MSGRLTMFSYTMNRCEINICAHMYVDVYAWMWKYIYIYIFMYMYMYSNKRAYANACMCAYIESSTLTFIQWGGKYLATYPNER